MLSENQARWMFDKLIRLWQVPDIDQEADRIRELSRQDPTVELMIRACLGHTDQPKSAILRRYDQLIQKYSLPEDSNEWWLEFYTAVNHFRQEFNYHPYVQELADAYCREMRRLENENEEPIG